MSADSTAIVHAYAAIGYAFWQLQALEHSLVHYLVLRFWLKERGAAEELEREFRIVKKMTVGNLLADLRDRTEVPEELRERLSDPAAA